MTLRTLYEHAQQGDVKEYILADTIGLFKTPGEQGFGPSQWHRDATIKYLTDQWEKVFDVIKLAKKNPDAEDLHQKLLQSARDSLSFAKSDWSKLKSEIVGNGYRRNYGEGFDQVFETIELELSILASTDEYDN